MLFTKLKIKNLVSRKFVQNTRYLQAPLYSEYIQNFYQIKIQTFFTKSFPKMVKFDENCPFLEKVRTNNVIKNVRIFKILHRKLPYLTQKWRILVKNGRFR